MISTENKTAWCEHGRQLEDDFVSRVCPEFGIFAAINPEKDSNIYAPDLVVRADLKVETTPFFTAGKYGIDPQYAVTLNQKDVLRYQRLYPDILILFHLDWQVLSYADIKVRPMKGVWLASMMLTSEMVKTAPLHAYQRRQNDTQGNAKASYVFDIRRFLCYGCEFLD